MTDVTATTTPIDEYLIRQRVLTPVERFAAHIDGHERTTASRRWRDLVPVSPPGPGEQYAFEIDLDRCTGCKACVTACHTLNGLDGDESWRRVGTLRGIDPATGSGIIQTVTHACHHCIDPACLSGCPVDAYRKDPDTGIVAHLDDQCIGCLYCTMTCPYEVPAPHRELGIVRKCDLCAGRLAEGEAPACVQGCPNDAIAVTVVRVADVVATLAADARARLVPGAPPSSLTLPTTTYRSERTLPRGARPVDNGALRPAHGHTPLVVMLVLTQIAVGSATLGWLIELVAPAAVSSTGPLAILALGTAVVALTASLTHLGRPRYAWRAVRGVSHSWLSREIVAFGLFALFSALYAMAVFTGAPRELSVALGGGATTAGVAGVAASVMVYAVTGRRSWSVVRTTARFALTCLLGGSLSVLTVLSAAGGDPRLITGAGALAMAAAAAAALTHWQARRRRGDRDDPLVLRGSLLRGPLDVPSTARLLLALGVLLLVPATLAVASSSPGASPGAATLGTVSAATAICTELLERHLFFRTSGGPRLPTGGA